jgi:hypothetical protein
VGTGTLAAPGEGGRCADGKPILKSFCVCVCVFGLTLAPLLLGGKSENVLWSLPLPTGHCFFPSFLLNNSNPFSYVSVCTIQSGQKCEMFGQKEVLFMVDLKST